MKHTTKRRAFAQRAFPISITSLLNVREVANRLFVTAPAPYGAFFILPAGRSAVNLHPKFCRFQSVSMPG